MNARPLPIALILLASLLVPAQVSAQTTCQVQGSIPDGSHPHYDAVAGMQVTLSVEKDGTTLAFGPVASTASGSGATYTFSGLPSGAEGIETGDRLTVEAVANGHTVRVSAIYNGSVPCSSIFMAAMGWVNETPIPVPVIGPTTALDGDDLVDLTPTPVDANGDAVTLTRLWGYKRDGATSCTFPLGQTGPTVSAGFTQEGDIWCLQVVARDEHQSEGQGTAVTAYRRIATLDDLPTLDPSFAPVAKSVPDTLIGFTAGAACSVNHASCTLSYSWDFGDGSAIATTAAPSHAYSARGTQTVTVTVTDDLGYAADATLQVPVNQLPTLGLTLGTPDRVGGASANLVLSDADDAAGALSYSYTWEHAATCEATTFTLLAASIGTSATQTLTANAVPAHQCLRLRATPTDGLESGIEQSASALVANSAPTFVTTPSLAPLTSSDPFTLSVTTQDADLDTVTCQATLFRFSEGAFAPQGDTTTCATLATVTPVKGERWFARVALVDGHGGSASLDTAEVTVANSPPLAGSLQLTGSHDTTSTLPLSVAQDIAGHAGFSFFDQDGDAMQCAVAWYREAGATDVLLQSSAVSCDEALPSLASGSADEADVVYAVLTPSDLEDDGAARTSSPLTIANAAPTVTSLTLGAADGSTLTAGDTLRVTFTASDPDSGDIGSLACDFVLFNGTEEDRSESGACSGTRDFAVEQGLRRGEQWRVEVTVRDEALAATGSASATVVNTLPAIASLVGTPSSPTVSSTLQVAFTPTDADGDGVTCAVDWLSSSDGTVAGLAVVVDDEPASCSGPQARSLSGQELANGQRWRAALAVADADGTTATTFDFIIGNTAPVLGALGLAGSPTAADALLPTIADADADQSGDQATFDPDAGQTVTCAWAWFRVTGETETQIEPASGTNSGPCSAAAMALPAGKALHLDTVRLRARPSDGADGAEVVSNTITFANAVPTATLALTPAATETSPRVTDPLIATLSNVGDADGHAISCLVEWSRDAFASIVRTTTLASCASGATDTLPASALAKGQSWRVRVTVTDTPASGSPATAVRTEGPLLIRDTPPTVSALSISPASPVGATALTASATGVDADGETVTLAYSWTRDGTAAGSAATVPASQTAGGQTWTVTVTPTAGSVPGSPRSASVSIGFPDTDLDGISDNVDNCPSLSNADQANLDGDAFGDLCDSDRDGDGVANGADNCPSISNGGQEDGDGDGVGDACDPNLSDGPLGDLDGDGVRNGVDNCRTDANAGQANVDGDALGDACDSNLSDGPLGDLDGDGVANNVDNCRSNANANQANVDGDALGDACDSNPNDGPLGDQDGDGVRNGVDNCPAVANADQANADGDARGDACDSGEPVGTVEAVLGENGEVVVSWDGDSDGVFRIHRASTPVLLAVVPAVPGQTRYTYVDDTYPGGHHEYYIEAFASGVVPPDGLQPELARHAALRLRAACVGVDTDGDGLCDAQELAFGSDPNASDADGDGLSDFEEILAGTDPSDPKSGTVPAPAPEGPLGIILLAVLWLAIIGVGVAIVMVARGAKPSSPL